MTSPTRRFYRLVTALDPPITDFLSHAARGYVFSDPALQRRAEEVSVWDDLDLARRLAEARPWLGRYVAVLQIPADVELHKSKRGRGHWGVRGVSPEELKRWVVEVVPL